jgi:predicted Fe-Mo cluster-binding NifX family protein
MKIAFPTDDGRTLSAHLGMARYYRVATLEDGSQPRWEQRPKPHHAAEKHHTGEAHAHARGNGHQGARSMFEPVADCELLVCRGMGEPAYDFAVANGWQVILTGEKSIDEALEAQRAGRLVSDLRRVHRH